MNGLIVYFSRTSRTRKVAKAIQEATGFDLEEIEEEVGRGGPLGWLKSGMESTRRMLPQIKPLTRDPSEYDIVVIGTPMWAANMSSPIRAFITEHKNALKTFALFCTGDGDEAEKVFRSVSELLGKDPHSILGLIGTDRKDEIASLRIQAFAETLSD